MARRAGILVLVLFLFVHPVGAVAGFGPVQTGHTGSPDGPHLAQTAPTIVRTMTFSLTPSRPGEVDVRMSFAIPDAVESLQTGVPRDATIHSSDGFRRADETNYSWNGRTGNPSITFALPANESSAYHYSPAAGPPRDGPSSGLTFVDTGPWAIVSVPSVPASWTYRGLPAPTFERRVRTDGPGVAGSRIVYLGPNSATTRTIDDQRVTLVVPEAATLAVSPDAIFDSLGQASRSLPVGSKPERSVFVAAPTSVSWGPFGVAEDRDAWVRADQRLADPNNVWIHEYVHVRQDFRTASDTRWLFEAMAEYYAASLSLQQGHITFAEFSDHLARGSADRFAGTVLGDPATWDPLADYVRGALVFGNLDRKMRLATDSRHPASHLLRSMNDRDGPVDHAFVRRQVASLADAETVRYLDRYVRTDSQPEMWSRSEHRAAFSTLPAILVTRVGTTVNISGPYRNTSTEQIPTLVPGEQFTVSVTVTNEGDAIGDFERMLLVEGVPVETVNGSLESGETRTITLAHRFAVTGNVTVEVAGTTWNVTVVEPAQPVVTDLQGPTDPVGPGTSVPITVSVENLADRPAIGSIAVEVDGSTIETWRPRLPVSGSAQQTFTVTFEDPGTHEIRVGEQTLSVTVRTTSTSQNQGSTTSTSTTSPGFGFALTLSALLLSLAVLVNYRAD